MNEMRLGFDDQRHHHDRRRRLYVVAIPVIQKYEILLERDTLSRIYSSSSINTAAAILSVYLSSLLKLGNIRSYIATIIHFCGLSACGWVLDKEEEEEEDVSGNNSPSFHFLSIHPSNPYPN
ncbi:hypothetical protein DFA_10007 [Cavenderia fasciculata]|uniref:Uncharacterized protein n=1 Tax=Cavenderia fasciculata TaxID=261658 RepID=F4Q912_CACFS|nr:uncharacterized protein DFA_10007 [Cavenderia fasciculata]EGG15181.1 hypothetical protein DFA_10007 [Cavenderia fasciculata]|eukprot:XP_004351901.1 hypothetical protein DFA_10007 [Cavenderia fasciculata]